ncbi:MULTISPECIES: nitrite/sulfite reductase [unclassified Chelatococcus]|uniref:nitrite/sulfite reductase n=1 Tax=unclassified Chelatococcus TaxID=2638111 RepID=UPI001BCDB7F7|nr:MULTISPECIES: nitrite/sulfite reductase [unclassified Chelatococcus]CAH1660487.1 Sulfite reductase (NADPH) hemoprotein beta-component [Hyphomicrobiales bacterium]MBS7741117.1 nitrite/sulfite reductase [Chelatococcus sp. HY11]MBX3545303.1 nitrite/sulfite reductase [Chelatococcus sp.]MCO5077936.1 nitrite/sulfite reductase [Chelatococcus sp.]CAH1683416.1 Sulfite reductase (NADPH) hemoprotein beta-component [Hyphomicrobiales bacterium]
MYRYDEFDRQFVTERVEEFRDQVARRLSGELTEDEFKPLRLMNGLYLQLHAYMLRIAIPYGTLTPRQLRRLADIGRRYDRGYGHFTTRQNLQFHWINLKDVPDVLSALAEVEMHAIQTSGNCIRNVSADHFAGAAADEVADPRVYAEILRQWSSLHPEFTYLPRKFKIAVSAAPDDRAAIQIHDIGLEVRRNDAGEIGFGVYVGGGLGRSPFIAKKLRDFLPEAELLSYCEAILRVYNLFGRRDNKYKARVKILLHEAGTEEISRQVEAEYEAIRAQGRLTLPQTEIDRIRAYFAPPKLDDLPARSARLDEAAASDQGLRHFLERNLVPHKVPGYGIVTISLKAIGAVPGDVTSDQMEAIADIAERYSANELRVSHEQNLVLPHVKLDDLPEVFALLQKVGLATPNAGLISDIIACPGLDYCSLANARSIPLAQRIAERFGDHDRQTLIGDLKVKISGCINACGHHHVGHIGILGVDRKGEEFYQITLGGSGDQHASLGEIVGKGFSSAEVVDAIETIVETYLTRRENADETFLACFRRIGETPFQEALYADAK